MVTKKAKAVEEAPAPVKADPVAVSVDEPVKKNRAVGVLKPIEPKSQVLYHTVGGHQIPAFVVSTRRDGSLDIKYTNRFNHQNVDVGPRDFTSYAVPEGEGPGTWTRQS